MKLYKFTFLGVAAIPSFRSVEDISIISHDLAGYLQQKYSIIIDDHTVQTELLNETTLSRY